LSRGIRFSMEIPRHILPDQVIGRLTPLEKSWHISLDAYRLSTQWNLFSRGLSSHGRVRRLKTTDLVNGVW
jgi:hypothetical protein